MDKDAREGLILLLVIVGFVIYFTTGEPSKNSETCGSRGEAHAYSKQYIRNRLNDPDSAIFPYLSDNNVNVYKTAECVYRVNSYVRAKNGFGGVVNQRYSVIMMYDEKSEDWSAGKIYFGNGAR